MSWISNGLKVWCQIGNLTLPRRLGTYFPKLSAAHVKATGFKNSKLPRNTLNSVFQSKRKRKRRTKFRYAQAAEIRKKKKMGVGGEASTSLWYVYSERFIHRYNIPLAHAFTRLCMICFSHVHPALCLFPLVTVCTIFVFKLFTIMIKHFALFIRHGNCSKKKPTET